ncbi:TcmI family type II polyketide cyclase [Streptomyces sp. NPDC050658]|uniref:TcmI family type II polyketide cyclase n=1 Tax=unclassified Streptomyces TaxID=2593676 RepID=UPI00343BFEF6
MNTTLIVAKMKPGSEADISRLFAASDATELPDLVGVRERRLLTFHDLYFHLVQTEAPLASRLNPQHDNPLFTSISEALDEFITPYQGAWGSVEKASARQFYHWQRGVGVVSRP